MHSQVQGLKACRFQARVKLAPPYLEDVGVVLAVDARNARLAGDLVRDAEGLIGGIAIRDVDPGELDVVALVLSLEGNLDVVAEVAFQSKNLKGRTSRLSFNS